MRLARGAWVGAALLLVVCAPSMGWAQADSVRLVWTAPGDDGNVGTATTYDLRMSLSPITLANWSSATPLAGLPNPTAAGTSQNYEVRGLTRGTTYYFAIRTADDASNWSGLSNVLRWDWIIDTAPPAAPSNLQATKQGPDVQLSWNANTEPDLAGYSVYRSTSPSTGYTRLSGSLLSSPQFTDNNPPSGANVVYYEVTASDFSGNESARSAAVSVQFSAGGGATALDAPYPNPSSGSVTFPVNVTGGTSGGQIEIVDAIGHRVRSLDLGALSAGLQLIIWDGKNDAGRTLAPGVYRARLTGQGSDKWVRLVRVP